MITRTVTARNEAVPRHQGRRPAAVLALFLSLACAQGTARADPPLPTEAADPDVPVAMHHGFGPAMSKVYDQKRGLAIGAYAEFFLERQVKDRQPGKDFNTSDFARYVQMFGYRFSDRFVFNAGIELQHASTLGNWENSSGSVNLEFGFMDVFLHRGFNLRAGQVLMPMGLVNERREPTLFHGVLRTGVESIIIPSTWSELGVGFFGEPLPGLQYRFYVTGGLNGRRFTEQGWAGGRQGGNNPLGESVAFVGRVDWRHSELFSAGFSAYYGGAGQGLSGTVLPSDNPTRTLLVEAHAQLKLRGLELRGLGVFGTLSGADPLSLTVFPNATGAQPPESRVLGSALYGWYVEAAYDLWPLLHRSKLYLAPYFRFERLDTQFRIPEVVGRARNPSLDQSIVEAGLTFHPHPQIAIKASYRDTFNDGAARNVDAWFVGGGFYY